MKPVKLFYLKTCPFCKKALRYIEEAKAAHPELAPIEIEMIEESEEPAVADQYDYYYVPTFYVGGEGPRGWHLPRRGGGGAAPGAGVGTGTAGPGAWGSIPGSPDCLDLGARA